jgi:hypothetical protein
MNAATPYSRDQVISPLSYRLSREPHLLFLKYFWKELFGLNSADKITSVCKLEGAMAEVDMDISARPET